VIGDSEDEKSMKKKKSWVFDTDIFDTGENDEKKVNQPQIITSKFKKKEFILKKKLKTKSRRKKPPSIDQTNQSKIEEGKTTVNDDQSVTIINKKEEQLGNLSFFSF